MTGNHKVVLNGHHSITVYGGGAVECLTCSLSWVAHEACLFMVKHGIRKMTVDGADLNLLY